MGLAVQNERLTRRVGAIALGLLATAFVLVFVLQDFHCRGAIEVDVYFEHAGALREGAPVVVAGSEVGEVTAISMVPASAAEAPEHLLHGTGGVRVHVRIEKRYQDMTLDNGEIFVGQNGIISPAFLELGPPPHGQPPGGPLQDGAERRGISPPLIDRVLQTSYQNLLVSKIFLAQVAPAASELMTAVEKLRETLATLEITPGDVSNLMDSWQRLGEQARAVIDKAEQSGVTGDDVRALAGRARQTMARTRKTFAELRVHIDALTGDVDRLRAQVPAGLPERVASIRTRTIESFAKLEHIAATLEEMAAMVERGEGNIGGLTRDPEFADHAKEIGKLLKRQPWKLFGTDRGKRGPNP